jgi:hypothetical protein
VRPITDFTLELPEVFQVFTKYLTQASIPPPNDFQLEKSVQESYYDPHISLLRGQGLLWYTTVTRAQIHSNALNICSKLDIPRDHRELSKLCKEVQVHENDDSTHFTYGAYYKLLCNALHENGINNIPRDTGSKLAPKPSQKKTNNELLRYVWHMHVGRSDTNEGWMVKESHTYKKRPT